MRKEAQLHIEGEEEKLLFLSDEKKGRRKKGISYPDEEVERKRVLVGYSGVSCGGELYSILFRTVLSECGSAPRQEARTQSVLRSKLTGI